MVRNIHINPFSSEIEITGPNLSVVLFSPHYNIKLAGDMILAV